MFTLNVRFHDFVEVGFVNYGACLGTLGLLLKVLAEKVKIKFTVLDLRASLQAIPTYMS